MAKVLIKVHVAYPPTFLQTLETQAETRRSKGERAYSSGVEDDKHNLVYVILDWESVSAAKGFWSSPEAKLQMADWHAVGTPEITVLRERPDD